MIDRLRNLALIIGLAGGTTALYITICYRLLG